MYHLSSIYISSVFYDKKNTEIKNKKKKKKRKTQFRNEQEDTRIEYIPEQQLLNIS